VICLQIEKDIYVDLTARQRALYKALLANVSVTDLLEKAANIGDADSARSLMNLVMQFRKVCHGNEMQWPSINRGSQVCNHPELFERADVVAPFSFSDFGRSGPLARESEFSLLSYSTRNPIEYRIPSLFYEDGGILNVPCENSVFHSRDGGFSKRFSIWSTDWMHQSLHTSGRLLLTCGVISSDGETRIFLLFLSPYLRHDSNGSPHTSHISPHS
jgi:DNA helicase INO80